MIDGYRTYLYYQSIKLHFTSKKFDAIEQNGRVKISRERFASRKDRIVFERIAKKLKEDHVVANYMIANFVADNKDFLYDHEKAMSVYIQWRQRKESLSYLFKTEVKYLESVLKNTKNIYTALLRELINKKISPETFVALDTFYNIFDSYTQEFLWSEYELLLTKYKSFVIIKSNHKHYFQPIEHFFYERSIATTTE